MGPVPVELHNQINENRGDFAEHFAIVKEKIGEDSEGNDIESVFLASKKVFEPKYFSERQLELLADIVSRFDISTGKEMEDFTHRKDTPWDKVWDDGEGKQQEIPYQYALDDLNPGEREVILNIADERQAFIENYK